MIDYPIHIHTMSLKLFIVYFKGLLVNISINYVFLHLKIVLFLANSADSYEMPPYATFHLGLHCLQKYLFEGI